MRVPLNSATVRWFSLDREGSLVDPSELPERDDSSPPLKGGSVYTPTFYVGDGLPDTHLHHKDGRIIGIHGEASLIHLRLTLLLCLAHEALIIEQLSGTHHFDIMLEDVLQLLGTQSNEDELTG